MAAWLAGVTICPSHLAAPASCPPLLLLSPVGSKRKVSRVCWLPDLLCCVPSRWAAAAAERAAAPLVPVCCPAPRAAAQELPPRRLWAVGARQRGTAPRQHVHRRLFFMPGRRRGATAWRAGWGCMASSGRAAGVLQKCRKGRRLAPPPPAAPPCCSPTRCPQGTARIWGVRRRLCAPSAGRVPANFGAFPQRLAPCPNASQAALMYRICHLSRPPAAITHMGGELTRSRRAGEPQLPARRK
jgi:hypothetical protein